MLYNIMSTSNSICTQLNFIQDYLVSPSDAIASGRKVVETKSWLMPAMKNTASYPCSFGSPASNAMKSGTIYSSSFGWECPVGLLLTLSIFFAYVPCRTCDDDFHSPLNMCSAIIRVPFLCGCTPSMQYELSLNTSFRSMH